VSRAAEIPRLGLGMTHLRHPERTRGISALRAAEIPRLRLGMTMGAMRLATTIAALRLGTRCGGVAVRKHEAKRGCNDAGLSSRAARGIPASRAAEIPRLGLRVPPHRHPERTRGISALRSAEIPRLRLGMTRAAVRFGTTGGFAMRNDKSGVAARNDEARPGCNDAGLSSRATRGIPASRAAEVPCLRLQMTRAAVRFGTTGGFAMRNDKSGVAARNNEARPGCNDAGLSSRANARDLGVASSGDSSPAARNDNGSDAARNDNGSDAARNDKSGVAVRNDERRRMRAPGGLSCHKDS
jgi:hypothetical protein